MNAHAKIKKTYFNTLVNYMENNDVDCCGTCLKTVPQNKDFFGKIISEILSSQIGVGNSKFRVGTRKTELVDSVHMAVYRKKSIQGMSFNEKLLRSQDIEFNNRLRKKGGKIVLLPKKLVYYFTRSNPKNFPKDMFNNGYWVTRPIFFGCFIAKPRHLIPLIFVTTFLFLNVLGLLSPKFFTFAAIQLIIYFALCIVMLTHKNKGQSLKIVCYKIIFLFILHFSYGLGSLVGLVPFKRKKSY